MFQSVGAAILDLIYPKHCIACGAIGAVFCEDCMCEIDFCYLPVQLRLDPLYIDHYLAAARLDDVVRTLVHQMKYNSVQELACVAGELLYLCSEWPEADVVSAVPLHSHRLKERGYNQAELIGRTFAYLAKIPYQDLLRRTVDTPHQAQRTSREDREQNIVDDFAPSLNTVALNQLKGKHIIIIDDVCTTGTTLNHCAKTLKNAGCTKVTALTLAHGR